MTVQTNQDLINDLMGAFDTDKIGDIEVLIWEYDYIDYEGSAFVLYRDNTDGLLYEVHGGHCSCYGLEGQWAPELSDTKRLQLWLDTLKNERNGWRSQQEHTDNLIAALEPALNVLDDQVGDLIDA